MSTKLRSELHNMVLDHAASVLQDQSVVEIFGDTIADTMDHDVLLEVRDEVISKIRNSALQVIR